MIAFIYSFYYDTLLTTRCFSNSKASASELLKNIEGKFFRHYMNSNFISGFKSSTLHERVKLGNKKNTTLIMWLAELLFFPIYSVGYVTRPQNIYVCMWV